MRLGVRGGVAGLLALALLTSAGPVQASCEADGTIPGTDPSVTTVSGGGHTFYVDDRDYLDLDEDGWGGLWIYEETNGEPGLQRGGSQWALKEVILPLSLMPALVPYPSYVPGFPMEPSGWGLVLGRLWQPRPDESAASFLIGDDTCVESLTPDRLWF